MLYILSPGPLWACIYLNRSSHHRTTVCYLPQIYVAGSLCHHYYSILAYSRTFGGLFASYPAVQIIAVPFVVYIISCILNRLPVQLDVFCHIYVSISGIFVWPPCTIIQTMGLGVWPIGLDSSGA
jgi:hypothetical protein